MIGFVIRSGVVSDELWAVIEPVLPSGAGLRGRPWNDHRRTLEGIAWRFRTGAPWRDLPDCFGAWQSVWKRHRRWSFDGTYDRMRAAVRAATSVDPGGSQVLLSIDSTSVRAHQHAAGAPPSDVRGATSNDKDLPAEPANHGLGRSRGGWTTKIHALTDQSCTPVTMLLSPGQSGDNPMLLPLIAAHRLHSPGGFRLLADKAYSHPSTRSALRRARIPHTIPERSDQIGRRKAKGRAGGRPPAFDPAIYRR